MRSRPEFPIRIRDPIHGTLHLSKAEVALVDQRAYQRLRMIKQLGMADLAFPGATHTRYAHGLGTMHVASRMFEAIARPYALSEDEYTRLLQTVRLAALFHDLGHAPLSHTTEAFMPPVKDLNLGDWCSGSESRLANHEDYTLKILTDSELTGVISDRFKDLDVRPTDIAMLIAGRPHRREDARRFVVRGHDWMPILRQCVSSELDADRMDYLLRDSYYAGVPYGRYDMEWLLDNMLPVNTPAGIHLGLNARASFGFEDYLLSRYHMFMSVYFHHIPSAYEAMLRKLYEEGTGELDIPTDIEGYLEWDDVLLQSKLRASQSPWAARIVSRNAYRLVFEEKELVGGGAPSSSYDRDDNTHDQTEEIAYALTKKGIDAVTHVVKGRLSKYFGIRSSQTPQEAGLDLFLVEKQRHFPVEEYSPLYRRYAGAIHLRRVYVNPERFEEARRCVETMGPGTESAGDDEDFPQTGLPQ